MNHNEFGKLISEFPPFKDGGILRIYQDGTYIYFTTDNKLEKTFHTDDWEEILGAMIEELV